MNRERNMEDKMNNLNKFQPIMLVDIPSFKAVASGWKPFGEIFFGEGCFYEWMGERWSMFKAVFLDGGVFSMNGQTDDHETPSNYIFAMNDDVTACDVVPYELVEIKGGVYAALRCSENDFETRDAITPVIMEWLEGTNFEYDCERPIMAQVLFCHHPIIEKGLGSNHQFQRYVPIKLRPDKSLSG